MMKPNQKNLRSLKTLPEIVCQNRAICLLLLLCSILFLITAVFSAQASREAGGFGSFFFYLSFSFSVALASVVSIFGSSLLFSKNKVTSWICKLYLFGTFALSFFHLFFLDSLFASNKNFFYYNIIFFGVILSLLTLASFRFGINCLLIFTAACIFYCTAWYSYYIAVEIAAAA